MTAVDPIVEAIRTRRSVRFGYHPRPVARDVLETVVACGLAAPSSKNAQPWRVHVVTSAPLLNRLATAVETAEGAATYVPHDPRSSTPRPGYSSTVAESAAVLREVPAAIWIENLGPFSAGRDALLAASPEALAEALPGYGFELIGVGAAVENMWIAANVLGLAAAFLGDVVVAEREVRAALGLEGDLLGVLALGYSDAEPPPPMDAPAVPGTSRVVWHTERTGSAVT